MTPSIHELFDKFALLTTKNERINFLQQSKSPIFLQYLKNAFDPSIQYYNSKFPDLYIEPTDMLPGIEYSTIAQELRRAYLFQKGNPTADSLTEQKRKELLTQILESLHPREADFFVRMLSKNLKVPFLTNNLVNEAFPTLL